MTTKYDRKQLEKAVKTSQCYSDILRKLGLSTAGSSSRTSLKKYCKEWKIDLSHLLPISEYTKLRHKQNVYGKIPLEEVLVGDSTYTSIHSLKRRLYREGLKKRNCELCGQGETWKGKKMSLILDHINGKHTDHRLSNLRVVCPNCNATLDTHAGKNNKRANGETASHTPPKR